jgi:hypothetical protein
MSSVIATVSRTIRVNNLIEPCRLCIFEFLPNSSCAVSNEQDSLVRASVCRVERRPDGAVRSPRVAPAPESAAPSALLEEGTTVTDPNQTVP